MDKFKTTMYFSKDLHAAIKKYCTDECKVMARVTEQLWREYLDKHYAENKKAS